MATLRVLMESSVEELKIVQTILLLVTSTDVVQGKSLAKVAGEGGRREVRGGREEGVKERGQGRNGGREGGREGEREGRKGMDGEANKREREDEWKEREEGRQ